MRCIRVAMGQHERTRYLRGWPMWQTRQRIAKWKRMIGIHGHVHLGNVVVDGPACPDQLLITDTPCDPVIADYIERYRETPGQGAIVGDTGDVLKLIDRETGRKAGSLVSENGDFRGFDGKGDKEAWEFWADPDRMKAAGRSVQAASVVTTSWRHMVEPLLELNPTVVYVPDYGPTYKQARAFVSAMDEAMRLARR